MSQKAAESQETAEVYQYQTEKSWWSDLSEAECLDLDTGGISL